MLRGVGHLTGQRRVLRSLIAVEHAVWVVLLRLLSQKNRRCPLRPCLLRPWAVQPGPRDGKRPIVVVVLRRRRDAIAGKHQRQIKPASTARGQWREVLAQFERDRPRLAVVPRGPHELRRVAGGRPELCVERHPERLKEAAPTAAPTATVGRGSGRRGIQATWAGVGRPCFNPGQPDVGQLFGNPVGGLLDALGAGPASLPLRCRQPFHRGLQPSAQRRIIGRCRHGRGRQHQHDCEHAMRKNLFCRHRTTLGDRPPHHGAGLSGILAAPLRRAMEAVESAPGQRPSSSLLVNRPQLSMEEHRPCHPFT